jgi:hypothetical protein
MPDMPEEKGRGAAKDEKPRTDLPPEKKPYDEGYFGTGEEEGVVKERELTEREGEPPPDRKGMPGKSGL